MKRTALLSKLSAVLMASLPACGDVVIDPGGEPQTASTTGSGGGHSSSATGAGGGGATLTTVTSTSSSSDGRGGAGGSGGTGGTGGVEVQCGPGAEPVFPTFDKTCTSDAGCVLKLHQINCCGTETAIGVSVDDTVEFDIAEAACRSQYPECGCLQQPTQAEDGQSSLDGEIEVHCASGTCTSYVP